VARTHVEDEARTDTRLAAILRATGTGTWEWTIARGHLRLDEEWLDVLGYSAGELDTTPDALFTLVHPDDQPRMRRRLQAHLDGLTAECECVGRLRRRDGTYQWRRERCVVVERGPDGAPRRVVGLGTNITDLGQAGERAHPWEHVFDQTQFGLAVTTVADDTLIAVNDAYARMHGYVVEELLGRHIGVTCELPADELSEIIRRINETGHVVGEYLHRRKNGTTFPTLHEIAVVRDAQGTPVSRVGFVIDVSARAEAVAALRQSEERFRAVYRHAPVGIAIADVDGRIQEANPLLCTMLGFSEEELRRETFRDRIHPDDYDPERRRVRHVLAEGGPSDLFETRLLHRSGAVVWAQVGLSAIRGATPESTYLLALVEDITDRRATDDALRQREAELRTALEAADAGTFAFDIGAGTIHFSSRCRELYGFGPDEPLTAEAVIARTHADDRATVATQFEGTLRTGADYDVEYRVVAPGCPPRWMHAKGRAVRDGRGAVTQVVGVKLDVTEQKLAFARIEASEERLRMVARATSDVLWDWDLVTGAHWWSPNAMELFGYDPNAEPDIAAWRSRLHPEDIGRVEALVQRVLADTLDTLDGEYRFRLGDGSYGEFLDRGHVVRDADGKAVRMIGAMTDVTELKRAHRSLMAAHERLQAVSRDVHLTESRERAALARELHDEFGQLLTAAKLSASSLRAMPLDGLPEVRQQQHAEKAANLCDVLDMALHGVRNVATQLRPPALDQLGLARALEGLAAQIERHAGLACTVTIDKATRARVFGPVEGAALYRMVQELVNNAARHAAAATVRVDLTTADGLVHLVVTDDGRGFPPEDAQPAGTLGLKGLRERAELLGGRIAIHSRPGAGTSVHITIPAGDGA
jgi:PAS domain S-box-containing protein